MTTSVTRAVECGTMPDVSIALQKRMRVGDGIDVSVRSDECKICTAVAELHVCIFTVRAIQQRISTGIDFNVAIDVTVADDSSVTKLRRR